MADRKKFDGKRLIEFAYRRKNGAWRLVKNRIDPKVKRKLGKRFFRELKYALRKIPNEYRPYKHEGLLLEILGKLKLDQEIIKRVRGEHEQDGQFCSVHIIVNQRNEKKAHGLAVI